MFMQVLFFTISLILTLLFFLYGFNHYYLLRATRRYKVPCLLDHSPDRPTVSVHLPIYNEKYVVRRLVAACAEMGVAYGIERVNIKILDDSTDETAQEVDRVVEEYSNKHFRIEVLHRGSREGFKAGALQAALERTEDAFIAIFDADFIPPADFLLRSLPYFAHNEHLGIIQSRWTHLNRDYNLLTKAIALGIDVHFLIEQTGRFAAGCLQNFNGSGGVLRKTAILEAGGWQADTLAEDLDLSYRMQNLGYQVLYLKDLQSPGEVPPTVPGFKKQQGRWACGSLRTARKILPALLKNHEIGWKQHLQAFIHLTGYMLHPLMLASFILICVLTLYGQKSGHPGALYFPVVSSFDWQAVGSAAGLAGPTLAWRMLILLIVVCALAPWVSALTALKEQNLPLAQNLPTLLILFLLGYGVSLSNTIEAGKALLSNRNWAFARTPKYATLETGGEWRTKQYQTPLDYVWILEFSLIALGGIAIGFAIRQLNFGILLFLIPYTSAYAFVFLLTILQSRVEKAA
jgi:cellulose synthase/poly-beta-1,6-N-acetylglucosamine synthase-like glycosyltransferase